MMLIQEKIQERECSKGGEGQAGASTWSESHPQSTLPCLALVCRDEVPPLSFLSACWEEGQRDVGAFPQPAPRAPCSVLLFKPYVGCKPEST